MSKTPYAFCQAYFSTITHKKAPGKPGADKHEEKSTLFARIA
jgi:hypothetical protein